MLHALRHFLLNIQEEEAGKKHRHMAAGAALCCCCHGWHLLFSSLLRERNRDRTDRMRQWGGNRWRGQEEEEDGRRIDDHAVWSSSMAIFAFLSSNIYKSNENEKGRQASLPASICALHGLTSLLGILQGHGRGRWAGGQAGPGAGDRQGLEGLDLTGCLSLSHLSSHQASKHA